MTTTTNQPQMQRENAVKNSLASVRMEGLEPSADAKAIFQQFVDGELTSEQMDCAFDEHLTRLYGSVPLSRNACSQ